MMGDWVMPSCQLPPLSTDGLEWSVHGIATPPAA